MASSVSNIPGQQQLPDFFSIFQGREIGPGQVGPLHPLGRPFNFNLPESRLNQQGLFNILEILQSQGKTDPRLLNRDLAAIDRGTQVQQQQARRGFAQSNTGRSGAAEAIQAGIGATGEQRRADRFTAESALTEERKRADLDLFFRLINDQLQRSSLASGQGMAGAQIQSQNRAADQGFFADLAGAVLGIDFSQFSNNNNNKQQ